MRVLIIDDDKLVCVSLKTILESQGDINVVGTGNSGQEALEQMCIRDRYSAVLINAV